MSDYIINNEYENLFILQIITLRINKQIYFLFSLIAINIYIIYMKYIY